MGQKSLKTNRRSLRRYAKKQKNTIVSHYMTDNWDKVLVSSVAIIRSFAFKNRLKIAMTILFRPVKKKQPLQQDIEAGKKDGTAEVVPAGLPQNQQTAGAQA